jgi:GcrA cell cycle regulator
MEWNDEIVARLVSLWDEGHSTAEIGRRINVSKNAVVGKAHRLNLPARPSPIRRDGASSSPRPPTPRRLVGPTLPPLSASLALPANLPPDPIRGIPLPPGPPHAAAAPAREVAPVMRGEPPAVARPAPVRPVMARAFRPMPCCWPIGEPGTKDFHFCDAEAIPGKPYCVEHAQIAYVKVRDRREEAA